MKLIHSRAIRFDVFPSPPCGGGVRGGGPRIGDDGASSHHPPSPNPPPQGGRERTEHVAAADHTCSKNLVQKPRPRPPIIRSILLVRHRERRHESAANPDRGALISTRRWERPGRRQSSSDLAARDRGASSRPLAAPRPAASVLARQRPPGDPRDRLPVRYERRGRKPGLAISVHDRASDGGLRRSIAVERAALVAVIEATDVPMRDQRGERDSPRRVLCPKS